MLYTFQNPKLRSFFALSTHYLAEREAFRHREQLIHILWNRNDQAVGFQLDGLPITLEPQQLTTTTFLQHTAFTHGILPITAFSFNRAFYCIRDHDEEVSCNGILFFGTQEVPIVTLDSEERHRFDLLLQVFEEEFKNRDTIQGEMLQMLLKRLIIKVTRLAKEQLISKQLNDGQVDLIRRFNVLVDLHFREKKQVKEYADLLHKSPKTLSNLFATYNQPSPLHVIHGRIVLEAKRLLLFTDKTAKEIAYELGFENPGPFHKLFKKLTRQTPGQFKVGQRKNEP